MSANDIFEHLNIHYYFYLFIYLLFLRWVEKDVNTRLTYHNLLCDKVTNKLEINSPCFQVFFFKWKTNF